MREMRSVDFDPYSFEERVRTFVRDRNLLSLVDYLIAAVAIGSPLKIAATRKQQEPAVDVRYGDLQFEVSPARGILSVICPRLAKIKAEASGDVINPYSDNCEFEITINRGAKRFSLAFENKPTAPRWLRLELL